MRATRSTAPVLRCKSKVKITLSRERVLASITAPRAFFFWQAEVLYTHTPSYARTHVTYIRNRDTHAVPSPCIIIQPRDCERDSHEWLCKAWARPPHRIFKSLKFLLVVNIVMLSAAVVTPSLSASGLFFSFPSSSLFLNFCLSLSLSLSFARSLARSHFRLFLPAYLFFSLSFLSSRTYALRIAILELDSLEKTVAKPDLRGSTTSLCFAKLFPSRFMCNNATQIKDDRTQTHPAIFEGDKRNHSVCLVIATLL